MNKEKRFRSQDEKSNELNHSAVEDYDVEDFFEEVGEYLDEVARGEILTADTEENGVIQMMFYTDDDEELLADKKKNARKER